MIQGPDWSRSRGNFSPPTCGGFSQKLPHASEKTYADDLFARLTDIPGLVVHREVNGRYVWLPPLRKRKARCRVDMVIQFPSGLLVGVECKSPSGETFADSTNMNAAFLQAADYANFAEFEVPGRGEAAVLDFCAVAPCMRAYHFCAAFGYQYRVATLSDRGGHVVLDCGLRIATLTQFQPVDYGAAYERVIPRSVGSR
jgi:hypothetical protein